MVKFLVACCTHDVIAFRFEVLKSEADRVIYDNGSFFSSPHGCLEHKSLCTCMSLVDSALNMANSK